MTNIELTQQMKTHAVIVALMTEYRHIEIVRSFLAKIRQEPDSCSTEVIKCQTSTKGPNII